MPADPLHALDRRNAERLRRGELAIEARLDLHGLTQDQAHAALERFLAQGIALGRRCVLIVTGKGLRAEADDGIIPVRRGVLRSIVPRWLAEPGNRARVIAWVAARPRHGGGGALYVLLKRQRER